MTTQVRPLPPQAIHLPFAPGPYRMAMDLVTIPEPAWFELDDQYQGEIDEKRRLLARAFPDVFAVLPASDLARAEVLNLVAGALTTYHPDWFSRTGRYLRNHLTGETWDMEARRLKTGDTQPLDPLDLAGRLVQEDLCLIQPTGGGPILVAASLCFPSRWRLAEKIGKPLSEVHGPVPLYADRLAKPVDRFMRLLKPGHIAARLNWSLLDDPALFQPSGKWRVEGNPEITPETVGSRIYLRVERQTLRRLPQSDAVLFGIRVHVYRLDRVIDCSARAAALAEAVRALPAEIQHYKSILPFREVLLTWLRSRSDAPPSG